jgi:hypothetical protein
MPALPISLTDASLTQICQLTRPLAAEARSAFLEALAEELRDEPQPVGDGCVARAARTLLRTGQFKREDWANAPDQELWANPLHRGLRRNGQRRA